MPEKEQWIGEERRHGEREDDLVRAVVCAVREEVIAGGMTPEVHREQHAFLTEWIAETRERRELEAEKLRLRRERNEKIKGHVMAWAIVAVFTSIGTWGNRILDFLREHLK